MKSSNPFKGIAWEQINVPEHLKWENNIGWVWFEHGMSVFMDAWIILKCLFLTCLLFKLCKFQEKKVRYYIVETHL